MTYLKRTSPYYKEISRLIYEKYGTGTFTCKQIQRIKGLSKFKCPKLRSWHNDEIVEFTWGVARDGSQVREWRFTQSSLRFFMGLP